MMGMIRMGSALRVGCDAPGVVRALGQLGCIALAAETGFTAGLIRARPFVLCPSSLP